MLAAGTKGPLSERVYPANREGIIQELPRNKSITFIDFDDSAGPYSRISPFATFSRAVDFFGDGSLYFVDTPGHTPGHMSAVTRIARDTFMFLGGDVCHHPEAYAPGSRLISQRMHEDIVASRDTVSRLAQLNDGMPNVIVVIAHDVSKVQQGLPLFPDDVRDWVLQQVEKRRRGEESA